ncbi:MAG: adenine deaminase [Chloroflexi bacterium]|jgi:enamidase|nr:adenine deaminase [Chloroflexota bacterium]
MPSLLIHNIGAIATGDLAQPLRDEQTLFIEDGLIKEVGTTRQKADTVVDAQGLTLTPGLIDGHVHPVFGEFTPTQNSIGWQRFYMHGGTTTMVSAGELHVPGLPLDPPDPKTFKYLAVLSLRCNSKPQQYGPKMQTGTLLLAPGLKEEDFAEVAAEGSKAVKFIFYPLMDPWDEALQYVEWAHKYGLVVKLHSGGVSRSGSSRPAGSEVTFRLQPDIVAHISGGPIPMPKDEMESIVAESKAFMEICTSGNYLRTVELIEMATRHNALDRVVMGTDTPGGTGIQPRGMLRNICLISSLGKIAPEQAIAIATGNTGKAHNLQQGIIAPGRPADLILMGAIRGSVASNALDSIRVGDLPGISTVIVDGQVVIKDRSEQTPPPSSLAKTTHFHSCCGE